MVKPSQVARDVRVVLNDEFVEKCIGDRYLKEEPELYLAEGCVYNDTIGPYVIVSSEHQPHLKDIMTGVNSGHVYLNEIDLKYPVKRP